MRMGEGLRSQRARRWSGIGRRRGRGMRWRRRRLRGLGAKSVASAADFWRRGLTSGVGTWYTMYCFMREKRENRLRRPRQNCRGGLVLLGDRNYLGARDWAWEGISLGGRRGFYGCEMGHKRFSHMSEIKFAHVRLTFCTCANYKSDMCEFLFHG